MVAAYAVLEGAEAVGLWYQKRWAEYLTFIATTALLPLEIYELTRRLSPFKIVTLVINVAVVVYLLLAKRLFGLRGGARAEEEQRRRDSGWEALERATPGLDVPMPSAASPAGVSALAVRPVLAVVLCKSALNLAFAGRYGWQRDELYYAVAGRHLQGGYVDFPPVTALSSLPSAGCCSATRSTGCGCSRSSRARA